MTTRELAEAIEKLILLHLAHAPHDAIELKKREIADGFKEHSGAAGVYVDPEKGTKKQPHSFAE